MPKLCCLINPKVKCVECGDVSCEDCMSQQNWVKGYYLCSDICKFINDKRKQ